MHLEHTISRLPSTNEGRKEGRKGSKEGSIHSHKRKVATTLHLADLPAVAIELQVLELHVIVRFLAGPLERLGPGEVAEPVADEVGVAL